MLLRDTLRRVAGLLGGALVLWAGATARADLPEPTRLLVVVGQEGTAEYGRLFRTWAEKWETAAVRGKVSFEVVGLETNSEATDHDLLGRLLAEENKTTTAELWLVLIGHGTFDGRQANFNLRGRDLSAAELGQWLAPFQRPLAVIDCAASSAPFLQSLSGTGRVAISATKSGAEENFAYFGGFLADAIADPESDLDKDGQTSLLEAFLTASRKVIEFYESEDRLATEHALLDDNGDSLGTPADWFRGTRAVKKAREGAEADGFRAHQFHLVRSPAEQMMPPEVRARRNELELTIFKLRGRKAELSEKDYYGMLEPLLLEMAQLYQSIEGQ